MALKTQLYSATVPEGQKAEVSLKQLKPGRWQGLLSLKAPGDPLLLDSSSLWRLRASLGSRRHPRLCSHHLSLLLLPPSTKDPAEYRWSVQITQDHLPIPKSFA